MSTASSARGGAGTEPGPAPEDRGMPNDLRAAESRPVAGAIASGELLMYAKTRLA